MTFFRRLAFGGMAASVVFATSAFAQSTGYFQRFVGGWTGGGTAKVEQIAKPLNVKCTATGNSASSTAFDLTAHCRALLIMNKTLGANITLNPKTGVYTGVYTGSSSGPAKLVGRRQGDTLVLKVTWGRKIYDDNVAQMLIKNNNGTAFNMRVIEQIGGKPVTVSDISFLKG